MSCPANYCDTDNDLSGASFGGLSIDDTSGYELTGNAITLGSGGLVTTSSGTNTFGVMWTPITLAANQTWMMNGEGTLNIEGAVSGVSSSLEVDQGGASALQFDADDEVGPFTAIGGSVYLDGASLNATDGKSVSMQTSLFITNNSTVGALTTSGWTSVGPYSTADLSVDGPVSMDSTSTLQPSLDPSSSSQLSATGNIAVNGNLQLDWPNMEACQALTLGTVYTLAQTTGGTLSGTFANAPAGSTQTVQCYDSTTEGTVQIGYTGTAVTATVVPANTTSATNTTVTGPASGTTGSEIYPGSVAAALSGATSNAGGTITFTAFGPQSSAPTNCSIGGTTVGSAPVSGSGTYYPAAGFTPTSAGTYWWYASYSGDSGNGASDSGCGSGMSSTTVTDAGGTTGTGPANGTGTGTTTPSGSPNAAPTLLITKDGSASRSGAKVSPGVMLSCEAAEACMASEAVTAQINGGASAARSKLRTVTIGAGHVAVPADQSLQSTFELNALGRRLLSDHKRLTVLLRISGDAPGGAAVTSTDTLVLNGKLATYKVSGVQFHANGEVALKVAVSVPGQVDVLVTAWDDNFASDMTTLNPASRRFVVGRADATAKRAGVLAIRVNPTVWGKALIADPVYQPTYRLWVSYTPLYASQQNAGYYHLQLGTPKLRGRRTSS